MKTNIKREVDSHDSKEPITDPKLAEELGRAIAEEFGDLEHLATYQKYALNFPETAVKRAYNEALAVPPEKIKRSRLAIFIHLTKMYGSEE